VLQNARTAGRLARAARVRGIVLDVEQYQGAVFDYARQRFARARSWNSYATQARRRGRELMGALQQGQPDLMLLLSFGHSLPWVLSRGGREPLAACSYGLLAPFVDGLLEGARGRTRVVDGYELSYGARVEPFFADARRLVFGEALTLSAARDAYRRRLRLAFGLWIDYDARRLGFSTRQTGRNYMTPADLERAARAALRASDEYVWVYAERPRWWAARSADERMPIAYDAALRRALADVR
jgi:hypothetical protein